ncbi:hypothetical protein ASPVEDRAFT_51698 [Aspergillus versicolor CBS 583.65]|uniref:Glucose N-acetyltransferase 1 n=1 Tax=Aspergillus versicolor CBS 583.65 TaxID=1036611 RepID=A0A1L9PG82_ASPVE|nr:uncharacterized protein ASPVEDRAFT_51698 [Aspergillus versicolor CBS 583.65]OJJ00528.1 hypothetical protein ASPVEDRAFT_51698 [Aspergillus versicolor CBS 583.65]
MSAWSSKFVSAKDWSRFAYVQYATDEVYLCNSVLIFEALHRLGARPDRVLIYPSSFSIEEDDSSFEGHLLRKARDEYNVKLVSIDNEDNVVWKKKYPKLLAFNQTEYDRVLVLDSDSTVLQSMDDLFLGPSTPVAMPRAYWLHPDNTALTPLLLLAEPSNEFDRITKAVTKADHDEYDINIMEELYGNRSLALPHRKFALLSSEFRSVAHDAYFGGQSEEWDPENAIHEAQLVHFADWPAPKPWDRAEDDTLDEYQPPCDSNLETGDERDCRARDIWLWLYNDFTNRRRDICGLRTISVPKVGSS